MSDPRNPQAREMADESMVRTLAAQADAIWPQESALISRYRLPASPAILDAGCGTGEVSGRVAQLFPGGRVLGVDLIEAHLELARRRHLALGDRVRFEQRSLYELGLPDASFDLTLCRHVVHSIQEVERVLAELRRVTRPGGTVHLIAEDYGMVHFAPPAGLDPDEFWHDGTLTFGRAVGTDLQIGRKAFAMLRAAGLRDVTVEYAIVDTVRVPRETFAEILVAWKDGYVDITSSHSRFSREETAAAFDASIRAIRDPEGYAVWFVPIVAGRV